MSECERCGRPKASKKDWREVPEGEGEHLCWGSNCIDDEEVLARLRNRLAAVEKERDARTEMYRCVDAVITKLDDYVERQLNEPMTDAVARLRRERDEARAFADRVAERLGRFSSTNDTFTRATDDELISAIAVTVTDAACLPGVEQRLVAAEAACAAKDAALRNCKALLESITTATQSDLDRVFASLRLVDAALSPDAGRGWVRAEECERLREALHNAHGYLRLREKFTVGDDERRAMADRAEKVLRAALDAGKGAG